MAVKNLSKTSYTIKAQSVQTITFMGERPNFYKITNGGTTPLYVGTSMMPTEDFFDMKIPPSMSKLCVDGHAHHEIYIYNPSLTDTNIIITSFTDEFSPVVMALSDIGQDFSSVEFTGEVDATGNLKTILSTIGMSTGETTASVKDIYTKLVNVISILERNSEAKCTKFYIEENTDAENMYTMSHIELFSNDSDSDLTCTIAGSRFILKAGEVLNKINLDGVKTIKIPKNSSYRIIGG